MTVMKLKARSTQVVEMGTASQYSMHHVRQLRPVGARADPVARRLRLVGEACKTGVRLDVDERAP